MSSTILFVCEHGSAKSIVAAAHFNHLMREQNLSFRAIARGTHPDEAIAPKAAQGLKTDGVELGDLKPELLSPYDLANAEQVITFCELPAKYNAKPDERWDEVPPISEDYALARAAIVEHLNELIRDLKND
jgi:protein-tyrosine-phosphatase